MAAIQGGGGGGFSVGAADVGTGSLTTGGASNMSSKELGNVLTDPNASQADKDTAATELSKRLEQSQQSQGSQGSQGAGGSQGSDDDDDPLKKLIKALEKMGLSPAEATQVAAAMTQNGAGTSGGGSGGTDSGDIQ